MGMKISKARHRATYDGHDILLSPLVHRQQSEETVKDTPVPSKPSAPTEACVNLATKQRIFAGMQAEHLASLCGRFKRTHVKRNKLIIQQGDTISDSSCAYMVASGFVTVHVYGTKPFDIELQEGDIFGELALVLAQTRSATIVSRGATLYRITLADMRGFFPHMPAVRLLLFLRRQTLLQNISDTELFLLLSKVTTHAFDAPTRLVVQGQPGHDMFIVRKGCVHIDVNGAHVATIKRGDFFGHRALHGKPRTATCIAQPGSVVVGMREDVLDGMHDPVFNRILGCDAVVAVHQHSRVFGSFDEHQFSALLKTIQQHNFEQGHNILNQGEIMNNLFIVQEGRVSGLAVSEAGGFQYFGSIGGQPALSDVMVTSSQAKVVKCSRANLVDVINGSTRARMAVSMSELVIEQEVGAGTSGKVYKARHQARDMCFAVKTISKKSKGFQNAIAESSIMQRLSNPFCVKLYSIAEDDTHYHLIMELITGGELFRLIQEKGKLTERQSRFYFACVLEAMQYLHRNGIVYRDLKPENVLLDASGYAKVTDFGFAKRIGNTKTFTICGTPEYQAPEIMSSDLGATLRADYWSLGVFLYEMLTGVSPFLPVGTPQTDPWAIIRNAKQARYRPPPSYQDTPVHDLISRLLQPNPAQRLCDPAAIQQHAWFADFDWRALQERHMTPPFRPGK